MQELRKDSVTKRWVIISKERANRPQNKRNNNHIIENFCPFDYGNEHLTPSEILAFRNQGTKKDDSGWWVRVVPNKFPALKNQTDLRKSAEGMYDKITGYGYHEVIIETPEHNTSLSSMNVNQIREILWSYIKRFNSIKKDKNIKYIQIFKNSGKDAGATLAHPHSQLIATPIVPYNILDEVEGSQAYYKFKERCVFCDMVSEELSSKKRLIFQTEHFIVFTPYASRFPYEVCILPKLHEYNFGQLEDELDKVNDLSEVIKDIFIRLDTELSNPPFNFLIHTSPFIDGTNKFYHWHIEIIPRLSNIAGFEWGTGFYINSVPPEIAAEKLRREEHLDKK